jgi:excisionase family DNA binding protein
LLAELAAKLCSVNPDTVLKWIRAGKLKAIRTTGGHCRVDFADLQATLAGASQPPGRRSEADSITHHTLRCWEYFADRGELSRECKGCVVYQIRASWCFKIGTPGCELGPAKHFCRTPCNECLYFQRVTGQAAKVLIVTPDDRTIARLVERQKSELSLGFARNGYEASAILDGFRPMFAVVDEELLLGGESRLLDYLACDARIQGMKIVLAVFRPHAERWRGSLSGPVSAVIEKPLELDRIHEVVQGFAVEVLDPEEVSELAATRNGSRG